MEYKNEWVTALENRISKLERENEELKKRIEHLEAYHRPIGGYGNVMDRY